ncbi:MAG TPA: helix-turn-helix transcriptional regulator [Pseudonocardia sp.]|nr:helix-turn-helix transcriptional regulator [Pseudonocardia sp.]
MVDSLMRLHIATGDPDEAHAWLRTAYGDHAVRLSGRRDAFRFSHSVADCGAFKVGGARHTMTVSGTWEPLGEILLFSHLLHGRLRLRSSRATVDAGPGDVLAYDPDARMSCDWSDIRTAQVRLDRRAVERVVAELLDDTEPAPVTFALARPMSTAREQHWKSLMGYVTNDMATNAAVHGSPLVLRQVLRVVVATALETFPSSVRDGDHVPARHAPGAVRRALEFIEEHAGEDVDLVAIARAARLGPRSLQRSFRTAMDTTPLAYLRSVRLDRAHAELRAADPADGTTVAAVAARWGFGNPGRFSADYRGRFGLLPSETLRA